MFLPAGSQDEIGNRLINRSKAYEIFRKITTDRNYKQISTPVVEYATTFTNKYAGMNLQNMLKWFNREGEIEVLRADWTTAIARAVVNQDSSQLKWSYQGSVFRSDKDGIESRQAGIEIVHTPSFLGESECLLTAVTYLTELNTDNYLIELGHTGIFEELTSPLQLTEDQLEKLRGAMHDKRRDVVYQIAASNGQEEIAEALTNLVDAYGSFDIINKYEKMWSDNDRLLNIIKHIKQLANLLKDSGVDEVLVDLGRVKNLPYYCGLMFRGFLKSSGLTCFSGGRYDKLYEQFDERISAVGLAFDVDVLAENLVVEDNLKKVCILATEASHVYAETVRKTYTNSIVDIQYEPTNLEQFDKVVKIVTENNQYKVVEA
ncbi:ATP phosphoribosyltransferase regulatory subunit [Aquibacillus rhizosphaerae]|uniref:ATP phosphoribosyltransferase regulatory subunit n=1 Tax=Aquibacillus rhizosphaerae TaxID=3051431 RepID=A0ABT7L178_9BACI|nr:ATP phosphoribosyltransferase regulatory subunit [Aquibacillus sp. LR5S19]MDL4839563.1 ATP phosphoribosyltransferase regulatory subunit [Aquibacillus sp. LR5S19]